MGRIASSAGYPHLRDNNTEGMGLSHSLSQWLIKSALAKPNDWLCVSAGTPCRETLNALKLRPATWLIDAPTWQWEVILCNMTSDCTQHAYFYEPSWSVIPPDQKTVDPLACLITWIIISRMPKLVAHLNSVGIQCQIFCLWFSSVLSSKGKGNLCQTMKKAVQLLTYFV